MNNMSKLLRYLNKLEREWHSIHQIAKRCWYGYHTIQRILASQTLTERQETRCLIWLLASAELELQEIEELCRKEGK